MSKLVLLVLVFIAGSWAHSVVVGDGIPETKVHYIKGPTITKYETKTETVTVNTTTPLPDTCLRAVEQLRQVQRLYNDVGQDVAEVEADLENVTSDRLQNTDTLLVHQQFIMDMNQEIGFDLVEALRVRDNMDLTLEMCVEQVEADEQ